MISEANIHTKSKKSASSGLFFAIKQLSVKSVKTLFSRFLVPFLVIIFFASLACNTSSSQDQNNLMHAATIPLETMGTWGEVKIIDQEAIPSDSLKKQIDSLLLAVNVEFSTYMENSTISNFNNTPWGGVVVTPLFLHLFNHALEYQEKSNGAFNMKILPLIEYYGFGSKIGTMTIDSSYVDSLTDFINNGIESDLDIYEEELELFKHRNVQFDFSAFAKGYGVDAVAAFLDEQGYARYMVEIGGEVIVKGLNQQGEQWRLGIETPNTEERSLYQVVNLRDQAMATSGNYRNYKVLENGQKLVHIVDPVTGYPKQSNLLSATIIADKCMEADAYATACMVMGLDASIDFVESMPHLSCLLIYTNESGKLLHYTNIQD